MDHYEYRFVIDAFAPETIPMARLAEYMADLARFLGHEAEVHFRRIEKGSAVLVSDVEPTSFPKVQQRLRAVREGAGDPKAIEAFEALDRRLQSDNAIGKLVPPTGDNVIPFPGRNRPKPVDYGPFAEEGALQGQLVRIGGQDQSKHLLLRDGPVTYTGLTTTEQIARDLRHHLFDHVRVTGTGQWLRHADGTWELKSFTVRSFEQLSDEPLADVVGKLRSIDGVAAPDAAYNDLLSTRRDDDWTH